MKETLAGKYWLYRSPSDTQTGSQVVITITIFLTKIHISLPHLVYFSLRLSSRTRLMISSSSSRSLRSRAASCSWLSLSATGIQKVNTEYRIQNTEYRIQKVLTQ